MAPPGSIFLAEKHVSNLRSHSMWQLSNICYSVLLRACNRTTRTASNHFETVGVVAMDATSTLDWCWIDRNHAMITKTIHQENEFAISKGWPQGSGGFCSCCGECRMVVVALVTAPWCWPQLTKSLCLLRSFVKRIESKPLLPFCRKRAMVVPWLESADSLFDLVQCVMHSRCPVCNRLPRRSSFRQDPTGVHTDSPKKRRQIPLKVANSPTSCMKVTWLNTLDRTDGEFLTQFVVKPCKYPFVVTVCVC